MSDLANFLLARIREDEATVAEFFEVGPSRVLADCAAKRRIVEDFRALDADYRTTRADETKARRFQALVSIGQLATAYADHPDYDDTWRP